MPAASAAMAMFASAAEPAALMLLGLALAAVLAETVRASCCIRTTPVALPLCGNLTGAVADTSTATLDLEQELVTAYQALHEAITATDCSASGADCRRCLDSYRAMLCARHVPCLESVADSACNGSRCTVVPSFCPALCADVMNACPFNLIPNFRCPKALGSLFAGPDTVTRNPNATEQAAWPTARFDQGCFGGWK
jgi:hypothetical protein